MTWAILYWILMLLWVVFGVWSGRVAGRAGQPYTPQTWGGSVLEFILFVVIGWKLFGPPVQ